MPILSTSDMTILRKNSTGSEFKRRRINVVEGSNVTITVADDSANDEIDLTIASSAGGTPGGSDTQIQFNDGSAFGGDSNLIWNKTLNRLTISSGSIDIGANTSNFRGQLEMDNDVQLYFAGGSGNGSGLKTGSDGTFLFDCGTNVNVKIKGTTGGGTALSYTNGSFTAQWSVNSAGFTTQNQGAIFNEDGNDSDFRVEGDTDQNLFFVDASTDRVGIGTSTPQSRLDIVGSTSGTHYFELVNTNTAGTALLNFDEVAGAFSNGFFIKRYGSANASPGRVEFWNISNAAMVLATNNAAVLTLTSGLANVTGSLQCDSITNDTGLASGTYTPTLTNVANLDGSTAYVCHYLRVGNTVTVSGRVDVDPTTATVTTQLGISLPVASNFSANTQCGGTAFAPGIAAQGAGILSDATNDRAQMEWKATDVTNQGMWFTFNYQVI